jgi:uncharacterized membrane protein
LCHDEAHFVATRRASTRRTAPPAGSLLAARSHVDAAHSTGARLTSAAKKVEAMSVTNSNNQTDTSRAPNGDARPSDAHTRREPESKETLGERIHTAAAKVSAEPFTEHLSENVAGPLCYVFGWVSGLVFLLVDRRPFVRFHAAQSVAVFATLNILLLALGGFFLGALLPGMSGILFAARRIIELGWLIAAVVLMLKASTCGTYRIPGASGYADRAVRQGR